FLEQVIRDCGPENEKIANLVLFLLTDEKGTRPMKTMDELRSNISKLMPDSNEPFQNLELILEILVESGLVLVLLFRETPVLQEVPPPRYQLVHDYLVELIRQKQEPALIEQLSQNQAELEQLRKEKELIEARAREEKLEAELAIQQEQQKNTEEQLARVQRQRQRTMKFVGVIALFALTALGLAGIAWSMTQRAKEEELQAMVSEAVALSSAGKEIEALMTSIRAGHRVIAESHLTLEVIGKLLNVVHGTTEFNRLEKAHSSWVNDVAFSPDDQLIASASDDSTVKLWKSTGELLTSIEHGERVSGVQFSPDGQVLATSTGDGKVRLWHKNGDPLMMELGQMELDQHTGSVKSIDFSPNGEILASASADKKVILWNLKNNETKEISPHQSQVTSVAFSPDGKNFATASLDQTVKLWKQDGSLITTLAENPSLQKTHSDGIIEVSFSPDGKYIASGGLDGTIKIWTRDGKYIETLHAHTSFITGLDFRPHSPNSSNKQQILASASHDGIVRFWKLDFQNSSFTLGKTIENADATGVRFSSNGKIFALTRTDNTVRLFNTEGMRPKYFKGHTGLINSIDFSPDGKVIVSGADSNRGQQDSGTNPGKILLWNLDGTIRREILSLGDVLSNSFSPNGQIIASIEQQSIPDEETSDSNEPSYNSLKPTDTKGIKPTDTKVILRVILRDLNGNQIERLSLSGSNAKISFSSDSNFIAISEELENPVRDILSEGNSEESPTSGQVTIWNILNQQKTLSFKINDEPVNSMHFNPTNQTLATAHQNGIIHFWDIKGTKLHTLHTDASEIRSLQFSPDGQILAFGDEENDIQLWDIVKEENIHDLTGHTYDITSIDFQTNNGKILAAASGDGTIRIWNTEEEDGKSLASLKASNETIYSIKFSPDGKKIAAAISNQTVLWNLDEKYILLKGCDWITNYLATNPNVEKAERSLCLQI
ncbi:MAG: hypothetical protein AAGI69_25175, partial [Cyanobacteria bacterium P01_H01_bin.21]